VEPDILGPPELSSLSPLSVSGCPGAGGSGWLVPGFVGEGGSCWPRGKGRGGAGVGVGVGIVRGGGLGVTHAGGPDDQPPRGDYVEGAGFDQRAEFLAGMSGPPARPAPDMVVGVEISYDKGVVRVVDIYNRGGGVVGVDGDGGGESVQVHWLPRHPLSNVEAGSGDLRSGYAGPDQVEVSPGLLR
jgi:hypothetical protein